MHEPAVTLTDYGLTLECWLFAALIAKSAPKQPVKRLWIAFFFFVGLASLLGGTVHGFLPDQSSLWHDIVWKSSLTAIGCTAAASWMLGAHLTGSASLTRWMPRIAAVLLVAYAGIVAVVSHRFLVAIAMYLPATVFLTIAMVMAHLREPKRGWAAGIIGLALTYAAAAVQQVKVAVHPVYFDHNALYHAIQAVALYLLFLAQSRVNRSAAA